MRPPRRARRARSIRSPPGHRRTPPAAPPARTRSWLRRWPASPRTAPAPASRRAPLHHARERNRFADVVQPADPRDGALDAQPEPGVRHRAVLAQLPVPLERLARLLILLDLRRERRVVVLPLAAADDLPVSLRRENVDAEGHLGILGVLLEVEGLHLRRGAVHQDGPIELFAEDGFLVGAYVVAPFGGGAARLS